jgi:hypothetical protein
MRCITCSLHIFANFAIPPMFSLRVSCDLQSFSGITSRLTYVTSCSAWSGSLPTCMRTSRGRSTGVSPVVRPFRISSTRAGRPWYSWARRPCYVFIRVLKGVNTPGRKWLATAPETARPRCDLHRYDWICQENDTMGVSGRKGLFAGNSDRLLLGETPRQGKRI